MKSRKAKKVMSKKDLKPKKVKGRITVLKAIPYKEYMIYIRKINEDIFEYLVDFEGQLYGNYMILTPRQGQTKLNKEEIANGREIMWSGAIATIDALLANKLKELKLDSSKHTVAN